MSTPDSRLGRSLVAKCGPTRPAYLAAVYAASNPNPAQCKASAPAPPWLLVQAGGLHSGRGPTGVEELLVRQASELYAQAQRTQGSGPRDLLARTLTLIEPWCRPSLTLT